MKRHSRTSEKSGAALLLKSGAALHLESGAALHSSSDREDVDGA